MIISFLLPARHITAEETINENLIQNGGFETITSNSSWTNSEGPENWSLWIPSGNPELRIDKTVFHEGKSLFLSMPQKLAERIFSKMFPSNLVPLINYLSGSKQKILKHLVEVYLSERNI